MINLALVLFFILTLILSCGNSGSQQNVVIQNVISPYDSAQGKSFTYSKYELPLSVDIFKFLKKQNIPFNILMMHRIKDQDKYFTEVKRAFALGVYSSDLAYAAINEQSQEAVDYFGATIELSNKLNIQDGYNPHTMDKAYKNLDNEDSLARIIGESYWKTCMSLENNKRDNILPLIVVGSWIESMHIISRNSIGSPEGAVIFNELYKQLGHLKNLILFLEETSKGMEPSTSKTEVESLAKKLISMKEKYQQIDGDIPANFSLSVFKDVIFQVEDLRNSMLEQ